MGSRGIYLCESREQALEAFRSVFEETKKSYCLLEEFLDTDVEPGLYHNMPQKQLAHKLLTASATVDKHDVNMSKDGSSENAFVPFTIINTHGFDLPKTGSYGNWMFPVIGLSMLALCIAGIVIIRKKTRKENS